MSKKPLMTCNAHEDSDEITVRSFYCPDYDAFITVNEYIEEASRLRTFYASEQRCFVGTQSVTMADLAIKQMSELTRACAHKHWSARDLELLVRSGVL